jgi:hypothetical protein
MIHHLVFFKLKDRSDESRASTRELILTLNGKVPTIDSLDAGADIVRGERNYDVALVSRFKTMEDLDAYRVHPYHQEVVAELKARSESIVAVDYQS